VRTCLLLLGALLGLLAVPHASAQQTFWLPGPNAVGDASSYAGAIDQPVAGQTVAALRPLDISGWVVDTSAQGWSGIDAVEVWDGPMDLGGHKVASATIQLNRPDVASALGNPFFAGSGFSARVPAGSLPQGPAFWYVYAHTPSKGWWSTPAEFVVGLPGYFGDPRLELEQPTVLAVLHGAQPFTVRGYAIDRNATPDQGIGVDRVEVYFNGDRGHGLLIGRVTPDQPNSLAAANGGQFANAGFSVTFQPTSWIPSLMDNQFTSIVVYAHSSVSGREAEVQRQIMIELP
jgi:hypothetical protein